MLGEICIKAEKLKQVSFGYDLKTNILDLSCQRNLSKDFEAGYYLLFSTFGFVTSIIKRTDF